MGKYLTDCAGLDLDRVNPNLLMLNRTSRRSYTWRYGAALKVPSRRRPVGGQGMKWFRVLGWGLMLVAVASPAAGPFDSGGYPGSSVQVPASQPYPRREADRPAPQRGSEETDRGHMSADERRQLRRDIQDAGRDIYRPALQRRGDPRRSGR